MKRFLFSAILLAAITPAAAQQVAPGWYATGYWQCGPVRITTSADGFGGLDVFVEHAWFNNHYTLQHNQLFYNGVPCIAYGEPWPLHPQVRRQSQREPIDKCSKEYQGEVKEGDCE
jgi:hypothetical protein